MFYRVHWRVWFKMLQAVRINIILNLFFIKRVGV